MKKMLIILGLILASLLAMGGCEVSTGTSFGLTIEDAFFGEIGADGIPVPVDTVFKRGEKVMLVFVNVEGFKKGEDGLNWYDTDMETKDSEGNMMFSHQGLVGEAGHMDMPNNILPFSQGSFTAAMPPGNYKVKLTIYDKIGGGKASKSKSFTVVE